MEKKHVTETLEKIKKESKKRNFNQSFDLIINLRDIDLKKTDNQIDFFTTLHFSNGKKAKTCALIDTELKESAEKACDKAILADEFSKYEKDKKAIKKMSEEYDYFIAQATIMPQVAKTFGRTLGPKGKMPNPKAGCVVPPNANLAPLVAKLNKTLRIMAKTQTSIKCMVGKEDSKDEEVVDNILTAYDAVIHHLPNGRNNIKDVLLKTTMGKPKKLEY